MLPDLVEAAFFKNQLKTAERKQIRQQMPQKKVTKATATFDVFLSHDWGKFTTKKKNGQPEIEVQNHECEKINNELKSVGLTTWFDEDKMSGNINDQMVSGIDHSSCFIAFITKNYILKVSGEGPNGKSDNCKGI